MKNEMQVIVKAKALAMHTFKLTSNCNRYPKKYRFSLVDKLQNKSLEIYEVLFESNRMSPNSSNRIELQSRAITLCDEILFYIELSIDLGIIAKNSAEYWSKMASDVKHMALAWRKTEKST